MSSLQTVDSRLVSFAISHFQLVILRCTYCVHTVCLSWSQAQSEWPQQGRGVGWCRLPGFKHLHVSDWSLCIHHHSLNKGLLLLAPWVLIRLEIFPHLLVQMSPHVEHLSPRPGCSSLSAPTDLCTTLLSSLSHYSFCIFNNYSLSYLPSARHYSQP